MPIDDARSAIAACRNPALATIGDLRGDAVGVLAYGLLHPGWLPANCRKRDPKAALALLEAYAGDPLRRDTGSLALSRLLELYAGRKDERARQRHDEIRRLLWLRGSPDPAADDPLLTRAEKQRLLSRAENVAFLRDWVAKLPSDPDPRRRLTAALLVEGTPHYDPAEAATVIPEGAPPNLRLPLLRALLAEERTFAAALGQVPYLWIEPGTVTGEDMLMIEAIVARAAQLFEKGGEPGWTAGARVLAALAEADFWQARSALGSLINRSGCCLVMRDFPPELRVRPLVVSDDDYPATASRARVSGIVTLEALFGPDGKLLYVDAGGGEPLALKRAAIRMWRRRTLEKVELKGFRGHYVRVGGPTLEFRLARCVGGVAKPVPAPEDGVLIDRWCPQPVMH